MYDFVDTIESGSAASLPSEAMQINGVYLENVVPGYSTLYTRGREALTSELTTAQTAGRDGTLVNRRRFPERIITVGYQIISESAAAFRTAFNALAGALNVEDAELIFNDEQDKYLTGTPYIFGEVEPGMLNITSEFQIYCADPFKYSVTDYEIEPTEVDGAQMFVPSYHGTYKAYPRFTCEFAEETDGSSDCNYVAFIDQDGHILQIGDPDDVEATPTKTVQVCNSKFTKAAALSGWGSNIATDYRSGTTFMGSCSISSGKLAINYGSKSSGWHGPVLTRTISTDDADYCYALFNQEMCLPAKNYAKRYAVQRIWFADADWNCVMEAKFWKGKNNTTMYVDLIVNGVTRRTMTFGIGYYNKWWGHSDKLTGKNKVKPYKACSMMKRGSVIYFNICGFKQQYEVEELDGVNVKYINVAFLRSGTNALLAENTMTAFSAKVGEMNLFNQGDVLEVDCAEASIKVGGVERPALGAMGNDWESLVLNPPTYDEDGNLIADNAQIAVTYSDFTTSEPRFKMTYKEVFL